MVTLQSAEQALKSFYLDAIKETINTKTSPFLAMIESSTNNVYGKDVKKMIRVGFNNSVAAGSETGDLPAADQSNYIQLTATLKNLYGTIEISDKAIRASQSNEGAFVNLLNDEMENLLRGAKYNFNRMLMGNGTGFLCDIYKSSLQNTVSPSDFGTVQPGMRVVLMNYDHTYMEGGIERTILYVDRIGGVIKLSGPDLPTEIQGYIAIAHQEEELSGLKAIFENKNVYGMTEEQYHSVKPYDYDCSDEFDEIMLMNAIDLIEQSSNSTPNLIICSYGVRRAIVDYYKSKGVMMPTVELEGGVKAITFNGIPIVVDRFCEMGTLYILNTDDFKLYQLCDWEWMESEDGKILRQVPGKPVYTATLVKYAELICERPNAQGRITNINEK
ncbi:MAG: phage major capsid protein [Clostridia bacterium]|nr:phage major capsid protein [Clostridia bacterium]